MSIDILENQATNGGSNRDRSSETNSSFLGSILSKGLDYGGSAVGLGINAGRGLGKYITDTFTAKKNNVPFKIRLAVAGARKAEDKLRTLRQFYPDAMPTADGDFTFLDPETRERVTLNDDGASVGDVVGSIPDIGEAVGGTLGFTSGGALGAGAGPVGTAAGGIAGAGLGAAIGSEAGRGLSKMLGALLTGKSAIDTRDAGDVGEDFATTTGLNSAFSAIPYGGRAVRNAIVKKNITDESASLAKELMDKGYDPTLSQIGSDAGKDISDRLVANRIVSPELHNQEVFQKRMGEFLGPEVTGLDQNALANKLREEAQDTISRKYGVSKDLYSDLTYSDDVLSEAPQSKGVIQDIYKKRGMEPNESGEWVLPENKRPNSDFVFEPKIQDKIDDIMNGKATEAELFAFEKDLTSTVNGRDIPYRSKQSLRELRDTVRQDLAGGSPGMDEQAKAARAAHFDYKTSQEKLDQLLGKTEGVSEDVGIGSGEGLTARQNLDRANKLYLNTSAGDDQKAAILSSQLSPLSNRISLASILQEDKPIRGFENSIEKAQQRYNMGRVEQNLVRPEERERFASLLKEAQGTRSIPQGYQDRSGALGTEAAVMGTAAALDPSLGAITGSALNVLGNAPGTYGGSGQFATALLRNNPITNLYRKTVSDISRGAAKGGEIPSQLNYMPSSPLTAPATMVGGQAAFGNLGDSPESTMRIPTAVTNEALPPAMRQDAPEMTPVNLDDFLNEEAAPGASRLDDLLKPDSSGTKGFTLSPVQSQSVAPGMPDTAQDGRPLMTLDQYMDQRKNGKTQNQDTMSLDEYMNKVNVAGEDQPRMETASFNGSSYELANSFVGKNEHKDRSVIQNFLSKSLGQNVNPQKVAWCAAFVNAVQKASGADGTGSFAARSFLQYGTPTNEPTKGDIVVLQRGRDPSKGHVGFFAGYDNNGNVLVLGGNQRDGVNVTKFPKNQVVGYRRPPKAPSKGPDVEA